MKPAILYRIAAVILLLFAVGHTFGFLSFVPPTAEGVAVRDAMNSVYFTVGQSTFSYGNFYRGFGLAITADTLLMAVLAWHLAVVVRTSPEAVGIMGWCLSAVQLIGFVLSWMYFSAAPALFWAVVAIVLALAAIQTRSAAKMA